MRVLYFGTYDRAYPAQRAGDLGAARRRCGGARAAPRGLGAAAQLVGRPAADASRRRGRAQPRAARRDDERMPMRSSSATPGTSTCPPRSAPRAGGPSCSIRSCRSTTRSSPTAGASAAARPPRARSRLVDRRAFRRADVVVADTEAHGRFFREEFGLAAGSRRGLLRRRRGSPLPAGLAARGAVPRPLRRQADPAPRPRDHPRGGRARSRDPVPRRRQRPARAPARRAARNVDWVPWVEYERLPGEIQAAGCALGIFGTSAKAARVIPNKAFQALACGTPLVTADTPAARELLTDGADALLVPAGRPGSARGGGPPARRRSGPGRPDRRRRPGDVRGAGQRGRARRPLAGPSRARARGA